MIESGRIFHVSNRSLALLEFDDSFLIRLQIVDSPINFALLSDRIIVSTYGHLCALKTLAPTTENRTARDPKG